MVIESKSIYGEVKVNGHEEWSRSYRGEWYGMPSPMRQAELQETLVKYLLQENVDKFLGRLLGIQTQIGGRDWRTLCAVSSSAILHRDDMPRAIANRVVKSEFVAEKVRELVGSRAKGLVTGKPRFSHKELQGIGEFLLQNHIGEGSNDSPVAEPPQKAQVTQPPAVSEAAPETLSQPILESETAQVASGPATSGAPALACKKCGEQHNLKGMYGKYGYYVRCGACDTNTSMKTDCPRCQSRKVRLTKSGPAYTGICTDCAHEWVVFHQSGSSGEP